MISIVSIPHTGTKFTEAALLAMGCEVRHAHLHSTHPNQDARAWFWDGATIVVPWREPAKADESARKRGETPRPRAEFHELLDWAYAPNVHLFCVEQGTAEGRASELAALARFVGKPVPEFDWTPRNVFAP
jgi:hypothetical protein